MYNSVLHLPINKTGRDIVVGDIHGEFSELKKALKFINFDKKNDRIISAGDLVDKGRNSHAAVKWIKKDYFFPVFGNHDAQIAFDGNESLFPKSISCIPLDPWFSDLSDKGLKKLSSDFLMYFFPAIQVETKKGIVGITHAGTPLGMDWNSVVSSINNKDYSVFHECMWTREIPKEFLRLFKNGQSISKERSVELSVPGILYAFHGHTPLRELNYTPYSVGNRYYIDTGAYKNTNRSKYPYAGIVLFDITDPINPIYTSY